MNNPSTSIKDFQLELSALTFTGRNLVRPESIIAQPNGTLWVSDGRGGIMRINNSGEQQFFGGLGGEPNGLAMAHDGSIFVANMGTGSIQKLRSNGHIIEEVLTEIDGVKVTCANFVFIDNKNRLWLSFSTREQHMWPALSDPRPDGYIVLLDENGPHIVADGIYFTNEIRLDAREEYLYVAETTQRRILRFRVQPDSSLINKEVFGPASLGIGAGVDGFTFDIEGNIWLTLPLRNSIGIITPDGDYHVVFEDVNKELLATFLEKSTNGTMKPGDTAMLAGRHVQAPSSITFGGPDLRTVYIGSLGMSHIPTFRSPIPGLAMKHWK